MDAARTLEQIVADIRFYEEEISQRAPLLRTVAGLTWGTATERATFVRAAVQCGYNESTTGVCWAAGRKFMKELEEA